MICYQRWQLFLEHSSFTNYSPGGTKYVQGEWTCRFRPAWRAHLSSCLDNEYLFLLIYSNTQIPIAPWNKQFCRHWKTLCNSRCNPVFSLISYISGFPVLVEKMAIRHDPKWSSVGARLPAFTQFFCTNHARAGWQIDLSRNNVLFPI